MYYQPYSIRTSKTNTKNCRKGASIIRLHGNQFKCSSQVLRIRYNTEHAFRCIIFVYRQRKKQSRRMFFSRKPTKRQQSHSAKWQYSHHVCDSKISSSISNRDRIRSTISQHPRSNNHPFNIIGTRSSTATYTHPCRTYIAVGIVNNTIKRQRSRSMEMRYVWLLDQKNNRYFKVYYKPGTENIGDYPSKAHAGAIHIHVRPYYLHMNSSLRELMRARKPSSRRGCVEILDSPYYKGVPLPRIPNIRELGKSSRIAQRSEHAAVKPHGQYNKSVGRLDIGLGGKTPI